MSERKQLFSQDDFPNLASGKDGGDVGSAICCNSCNNHVCLGVGINCIL